MDTAELEKQAAEIATQLSGNEAEALLQLFYALPIAIDEIPTRTTRDRVMDRLEPGIALWRKLEKRGLVIFVEEEPITLDDGSEFLFTAFLEPTDLAYWVRKAVLR